MSHDNREYVTEALRKLANRRNLTEQEMFDLFEATVYGDVNDVQFAGLLVGLTVKGETDEELAGAGRGLRAHASKIKVDGSPVVDIIGTGNDVQRTFNISTAAAMVVAGAGCIVAKHGSASVMEVCSSAGVLEACGYDLDASPEKVEDCIAQIGIGFMFSAKFHPAFRRARTINKTLGIRTIFNMLAPLANPAGADCMVVGVFAGELTEKFAAALKNLGVKSALVVFGYGGMDEISVTSPTRITELRDGRIRTYNIRPEHYFKTETPPDPEELAGGTPAENATTLHGILDGSIRGTKRNIVLINAGAALYAAGKVSGLEGGIEMARESIDSGAARNKLERMIEFMKKSSS